MPEQMPQHEPTPEEMAEADRLMTWPQKEMSKQQEARMERNGVVLAEIGHFGENSTHDPSEADKAFRAKVLGKWPNAYAGQKLSGKTDDGRSIEMTGVLTRDGENHFEVFINGKAVPERDAEALFMNLSKSENVLHDYESNIRWANEGMNAEYPSDVTAANFEEAERELYADFL